jgi:tRNA(Arg) A34 adenosine deaminase TadA
MGKWEKLSRPWQACVEQAWESYCANSIPIGAAVTDADGKILSVGRNRIYEQPGDGGDKLSGTPLAHAEMNALISLDYRNVDPRSTILYTTSEPCPLCIGGLYMAGVRELRYASRDPYTGSVDLLESAPYLKKKQIRVIGPEDPTFERLILTWLVEYKMRITDKSYKKVLDAWEGDYPRAVEDGKKIYESGVLDLLRQKQTPALEFLNRLENLVV